MLQSSGQQLRLSLPSAWFQSSFYISIGGGYSAIHNDQFMIQWNYRASQHHLSISILSIGQCRNKQLHDVLDACVPQNLGTPKPVVFLTKQNQQQNSTILWHKKKCGYIYCIDKPNKIQVLRQKSPCPPENPPVFFVESRSRPDPTPTLLPLAKVKIVKKYSATPNSVFNVEFPGCNWNFAILSTNKSSKLKCFLLICLMGWLISWLVFKSDDQS